MRKIFAAVVFGLLVVAGAGAQEANVTKTIFWDPVTQNVNGAAITGVTYEVNVYGPTGATLASKGTTATSIDIPLGDLPAGVYTVGVWAISKSGVRSASTTIKFEILDTVPPKPPTGVGCR